MMHRSLRRAALVAALVLGTGTLGCHGGPPPPGRVYVVDAPPPRRVDIAGAIPGPGWLWIPGHYKWDRTNGYLWETGHWDRAPRGYRRWEPGRWRRERGGWFWTEGHWRR